MIVLLKELRNKPNQRIVADRATLTLNITTPQVTTRIISMQITRAISSWNIILYWEGLKKVKLGHLAEVTGLGLEGGLRANPFYQVFFIA